MRFTRLSAVAVVLGLAALAVPAFAAGPPYTVTANGNTSGNYAYSAHSNGLTVTIHHGTTNQVFTCSGATLGGNVTAGASVNPVADIASSMWTGCLFAGQPITVTPSYTPPWTFAGSGLATTGNNDQVAGSVGDVNMALSLFGGLCSFTMTGSMNATFDENNGVNQSITVNETAGNLRLSGVSVGCFGIFANGDSVDLVTNTGTPFVLSGAAVPVYLS